MGKENTQTNKSDLCAVMTTFLRLFMNQATHSPLSPRKLPLVDKRALLFVATSGDYLLFESCRVRDNVRYILGVTGALATSLPVATNLGSNHFSQALFKGQGGKHVINRL